VHHLFETRYDECWAGMEHVLRLHLGIIRFSHKESNQVGYIQVRPAPLVLNSMRTAHLRIIL
jgi:hypothetical protein